MFQKIREFFYKQSMLRVKRRALYEVESDMDFISEFQADLLYADMGKLRGEYSKLRAKAQDSELNEKEQERFNYLGKFIPKVEKKKAEFMQLQELREYAIDYIKYLCRK